MRVLKSNLAFILWVSGILNCFPQKIDTLRIIQKADSIVIANSSKEFLDSIKYSEGNFLFSNEIDYRAPGFNVDLESDTLYSNKYKKKSYTVWYQNINVKDENIFICNDSSSYMAWHIRIDFNDKLKVTWASDFKTLEKARNRILRAKIISRKDAIEIAEPLFTLQFGKRGFCCLQYRAKKDRIEWFITKEETKADESAVVEYLLMNAESGEIIEQHKGEVQASSGSK